VIYNVVYKQESYQILFLLLAGLLSGFMNTLASSGTAVTLPMMIFMGIPPAVANATNRLPLLAGAMMAIFQFHRAKFIPWRKALLLSVPLAVGTAAGVLYIGRLSDESVKYVLVFALCVSVMVMLSNRGTHFNRRPDEEAGLTWLTYLLVFLVGLWAGAIVLDSAIYLLFLLVLNQRLDIGRANAMKAVFLLVIGIVSILLFTLDGNIDYEAGILLSIGSMAGSYFGSRFAIMESSRKWIFRFIIVAIIVEMLYLVFKTRV
jgi:uncharacterized membrane protein YfcA